MKIEIGRLPKAETVKALREVAEFIRNLPFVPNEIEIKIEVDTKVWLRND